MIKFTVITVCYNAEIAIRQTMESVLSQDYAELEYLVIDGKSSDHTVAYAEEIRRKQPRRQGRCIMIYSERDSGIYNAMNRGIVRAAGDYVIFLNAGDTFCDDRVLKRAAHIISRKGYGIYYGTAYKVCRGRVTGTIDYGKDKRPDLVKLLHATAPNHQATFAPLSSLKRFYFDERYTFCADLDWLIRCYKAGIKLVNMDYPVCRFDLSGVSHRGASAVKGKKDIYEMLESEFPVLGRLAVLWMEIR